MSEEKLQKKASESIREKTQYALAFGVIATMLFAVGFPTFIIVFFGIFAFFLWKTFASPSPGGTREIFEFYLSANEILRDDERRWFGFEMQEIIGRGKRIVQLMNGAPPLVYFTLGALYNRAGDHKSAVSHLSYIIENENSDEKKYLYATPELKSYVRILRKIEREPAEHPQTAAAVRALERARRNRGKTILEESRSAVKEIESQKRAQIAEPKSSFPSEIYNQREPAIVSAENQAAGKDEFIKQIVEPLPHKPDQKNFGDNGKPKRKKTDNGNFAPRRPISEVLRDIYDEK
ncbi:MAG: hypothetical protein ACR2GD_14050 [Pyrinomonadaceae bacterium]